MSEFRLLPRRCGFIEGRIIVLVNEEIVAEIETTLRKLEKKKLLLLKQDCCQTTKKGVANTNAAKKMVRFTIIAPFRRPFATFRALSRAR